MAGMTISGRVQAALKLPNGARFYRCALQVNPFAYLGRHKKQTTHEGSEYHRDRAVAIINASDVNSPDDLKKDGANCFIKMSNISVEALRQAFLDPQSRIRLNSDRNRNHMLSFWR